MGGHGGLNILPQKKWNVYNQDNRLKVARDEAAYADKQQQLAEKHAAAEREHRLQTLKQRARQRHGGAATINLDEGQQLEHHQADDTQNPLDLPLAPVPNDNDDEMSVPREHIYRSLKRAPGTQQSQPKRQRREGKYKSAPQKERRGAPSLAELASQLDSKPTEQQQQHIEGEKTAGNVLPNAAPTREISFVNHPEPLLQHINLFAEEEARAKNPETISEKRSEQKRRGDPKTQTTDLRFDESFKLGHGFTGKAAMPWYAHPISSLLPHEDGQAEESFSRDGNSGHNLKDNNIPGQHAHRGKKGISNTSNHAEGRSHGVSVSVMEEWKEKGQAALTASAAAEKVKEKEGGLLLQGVVIVLSKQQRSYIGKEKKRKRRNVHGDSSATTSSSGTSNGSTSESESSEDESKSKRRRKSRRSEKKAHRKGKNEMPKDKKGDNKVDKWSLLREERLKREEAERVRQKQAVRAALGKQGPTDRRYYGGYGHGH